MAVAEPFQGQSCSELQLFPTCRRAFDPILRGKSFVGRSKTGTGKTAGPCLSNSLPSGLGHKFFGVLARKCWHEQHLRVATVGKVAYLLPLLERMRHEPPGLP